LSRRAPAARHRARELLFRVVYQSDLTRDDVAAAWARAAAQERLSDDQRRLVADAIGVLERRAADVDAEIRLAAERWTLERLAATDRSVLRAAVAELLGRPGTPVRVVLDEAIEIARRYGSEASGAFVNGVLDRIARRLRPGEL
jgi:N utilization substance protein B